MTASSSLNAAPAGSATGPAPRTAATSTKSRAKQIMRQIYVDLVRRRSRVRIVPAADVQLASAPIFIVGPYRSGTTLLRYVVDSHSSIACPPESDFLATLKVLVLPGRASSGLSSMGYERNHVMSKIRELAEYFFGNYAGSRGKTRWADKSPTYAEHLPFLRELFPHAQFVFIHRDPLDQIHSHTKGGTHTNAFIDRHAAAGDPDIRLAAARYWVATTRAIVDFADSDGSSYQLRYDQLCDRPRVVLRELFDFLGEAWEEQVLHYGDVDHDLGMEAARTRAARGFVASAGHAATWPSAIREQCVGIVRDQAQAIGYGGGYQ